MTPPIPSATPPSHRRPWRARAALLALGAITLLLSAVLHLATPSGRVAARDLIVLVMNSRTRGTTRIAALSRLDPGGVELRGVEVIAPSGTVVIQVDRLEAELDLLEVFRSGRVLLAPCTLDGGTMRLTRGPTDQIELLSAMDVPLDRLMLPVDVHDIRMRNVTVHFDLPGSPPLVMTDVSGLVDMSLGHSFSARVDRMRGVVNMPPLRVGFDHLSGRLRSDAREPLRMVLVLDLEIIHPGMRIHYVAPRAIGGEGGPSLGVDLGVDVDHHDG